MNNTQDLFRLKGLVGSKESVRYAAHTDLAHLDEVLYGDDSFGSEETVIMVDDKNSIVLDSPAVQIPALGLECFEGTWMAMDENGELSPDWSLTLIHKAGEPLEDGYGYYVEQDSIPAALHNYLNSSGAGMSQDKLLSTPVQVLAVA